MEISQNKKLKNILYGSPFYNKSFLFYDGVSAVKKIYVVIYDKVQFFFKIDIIILSICLMKTEKETHTKRLNYKCWSLSSTYQMIY